MVVITISKSFVSQLCYGVRGTSERKKWGTKGSVRCSRNCFSSTAKHCSVDCKRRSRLNLKEISKIICGSGFHNYAMGSWNIRNKMGEWKGTSKIICGSGLQNLYLYSTFCWRRATATACTPSWTEWSDGLMIWILEEKTKDMEVESLIRSSGGSWFAKQRVNADSFQCFAVSVASSLGREFVWLRLM